MLSLNGSSIELFLRLKVEVRDKSRVRILHCCCCLTKTTKNSVELMRVDEQLMNFSSIPTDHRHGECRQIGQQRLPVSDGACFQELLRSTNKPGLWRILKVDTTIPARGASFSNTRSKLTLLARLIPLPTSISQMADSERMWAQGGDHLVPGWRPGI